MSESNIICWIFFSFFLLVALDVNECIGKELKLERVFLVAFVVTCLLFLAVLILYLSAKWVML